MPGNLEAAKEAMRAARLRFARAAIAAKGCGINFGAIAEDLEAAEQQIADALASVEDDAPDEREGEDSAERRAHADADAVDPVQDEAYP